MIQGNTCPNCNESILSFSEFIKITNTNKTLNCENCGKELKIKNNFAYLILMAVVIGLAIPTFIFGAGFAPEPFYKLSATSSILTIILYVLLWIVSVNFIAWSFVGWKEVNV